MAGEAEKRLYDAATKGNLATLQDLLNKDPYLLDGTLFAYSRNLLHIATMWEQAAIVEDLLSRNPKLAEDLDSNSSSPLHIAAAKGNSQIVPMLLAVAPDMCWSRDSQGMNPVHVAAKNGHAEVLEHLLEQNPSSGAERLDRGQTVLHLCTKHGRLRSLQVLVKKFGDLVNVKDDNGEGLLHLAVRCNQLEMVRYLVESTNIIVATKNSTGYTPMAILKRIPSNPTTSETKEILEKHAELIGSALYLNSRTPDNIMVVLALIASVAFTAIVNPPGGVWQDNSPAHKAGEAVMASNRPNVYKVFIGFNTGAFVASLIAMYTLTPSRRSPVSSVIGICGFTVALMCVGLSYALSLMVILPNPVKQEVYPAFYAYFGILFSFLICLWLAFVWNERKVRD